MRGVIDSSSLIALAWAGRLDVVRHSPLDLLVPDVVHEETVVLGAAAGHPDATAIAAVLRDLGSVRAPAGPDVDARVLHAARDVGGLVSDDLVLGRRARNVGAWWLRTGGLVVLCARTGRLDVADAAAALHALLQAGRVTTELGRHYLRLVESTR